MSNPERSLPDVAGNLNAVEQLTRTSLARERRGCGYSLISLLATSVVSSMHYLHHHLPHAMEILAAGAMLSASPYAASRLWNAIKRKEHVRQRMKDYDD